MAAFSPDHHKAFKEKIYCKDSDDDAVRHHGYLLSLWGLSAQTKIGQAGSTLDIRLPQKIIEFLDLSKGEEVTLYPETRRKLVVEL